MMNAEKPKKSPRLVFDSREVGCTAHQLTGMMIAYRSDVILYYIDI